MINYQSIYTQKHVYVFHSIFNVECHCIPFHVYRIEYFDFDYRSTHRKQNQGTC